MKAIFITDKDVNLTFSGAEIMTNRNYLSLCAIFGVDNVDVLQLDFLTYRNKLFKLFNAIRGYNDFLNPKVVNELVKKSNNYDHIILDFSIWGIISKKLKKNGFKGKIHCFFHNVEFSYSLQETRWLSISDLVKLYVVFLNELLTCKYSDTIIALNIRDANEIFKFYKRKPEQIIPISFSDANMTFPNLC